MKKLLLGSFITLFFIAGTPLAVSAHSTATETSGNTQGAETMMDGGTQSNAVSVAQHKEKEGLMVKMMSNTMTADEARQLLTLMQNSNGKGGMMGMMGGATHGSERDMMGSWQGSTGMMIGMGLLAASMYLIWFAVGLLLIVLLWKKVVPKKQ